MKLETRKDYRIRRHMRLRQKVQGTAARPRMSIAVTNAHMYVQFIDDDAGTTLLHPSPDATARIFTIPANSSVAFPVGTALTFVNQNAAGSLTIAITSDTMRLAGSGATGSRTLAANGIATALKISTTEWIINGANLT